MECQSRRLAVLASCLALADGLRASSPLSRHRPAAAVSWQVPRATRLEEGEGSLLDSALGSLSEADRYNVVLQGMLQSKGQATEVLEEQVWPLVRSFAAHLSRDGYCPDTLPAPSTQMCRATSSLATSAPRAYHLAALAHLF